MADVVIDRILDRLLHDRAYRRAFIEDPSSLGLTANDADALAAIDAHELATTAESILDDVCQRRHRGSGTLAELYAESIGGRDFRALVEDFVQSEWHSAYREIGYSGIGLSLEDAFFRFLTDRAVGEATTRAKEHRSAMARALVSCPEPDFLVPDEFRTCPQGRFAIVETTLFAALEGRFVTGELDAFLVALLTTTDAAATAAEHDVSDAGLEAALVELRALGLRD